MYDLIVAGAGPAGSSAAITAALAGARVLLLERGRFPRQKVCGEFVSAESLNLLASLLQPSHRAILDNAIPIPRARIFLDGRTLQTPVDPPASSIARLELDVALWQSALACGVDGRQQVTVNQIASDGPFRVLTSAGEFEARAVINTTGRWSNLSGGRGPSNSGQKWLGVKAHFSETVPANSVDLYFFDGGYCGVQPVPLAGARESRINVCAMVRSSVASTLPEVFQQNPDLRERSTAWTILGDPVSTSPLVFRRPQPVQGMILHAGDAAGFVDPFVGDGISLALRSGALASESLAAFLRGDSSLSQAAHNYARAYEHRLLPVFRSSSWIRRLLALPEALRSPLVRLAEKTPAVARYLASKTR
jgi:flavin-dependent dehydrogenase